MAKKASSGRIGNLGSWAHPAKGGKTAKAVKVAAPKPTPAIKVVKAPK